MRNLFKKKKEEPGTIFPTAEDMLGKTSKKWPVKSEQAILRKINDQSDEGERWASFYNARISEETSDALRQRGYTVKVGTYRDAPYFVVSW